MAVSIGKTLFVWDGGMKNKYQTLAGNTVKLGLGTFGSKLLVFLMEAGAGDGGGGSGAAGAAPGASQAVFQHNSPNDHRLIWDSLAPESTVFFIPGIYHHQLGALIRQYSDNTEYLCDRLKAISDKRRLDIIKLIKNESLCGQDLAERIGLSPATISHHMSSLVSAGFINVDKQNPRVSYSINQEFIKSFIQNLSNTLL